jgi:lysozyme family protein
MFMANFDIAIGPVLANEGGYVSNPNDPGGETKYGITKRQYPDLDIKNLSPDQAKEIYRRNYWQFDSIQNQTIANKLLDMCVNMGVGSAIRLVQTAVQVAVDGRYGPQTEAAINNASADKILQALRFQSVIRYLDLIDKNPKLAEFKRGWLMRAVA